MQEKSKSYPCKYFFSSSASVSASSGVLNAEKLMRLGWKPKYDLAAGLAHTIEICK